MCVCSSQAESRFPKTLLSVSLVFKPGKGIYFSTVRPWDWDTQYVVYTAHFPWKIYLQFPSSSASPPKGAGLIWADVTTEIERNIEKGEGAPLRQDSK